MPELPEIETVKNVIEPQIQGIAIEKVTMNRPEVVAHPGAEEFCRDLTGQIISRMGRRGKFLLIWLKNNSCIVLHLRMTGCLTDPGRHFTRERSFNGRSEGLVIRGACRSYACGFIFK